MRPALRGSSQDASLIMQLGMPYFLLSFFLNFWMRKVCAFLGFNVGFSTVLFTELEVWYCHINTPGACKCKMCYCSNRALIETYYEH